MKKIQIDEKLFIELIKYHLYNADNQELIKNKTKKDYLEI